MRNNLFVIIYLLLNISVVSSSIKVIPIPLKIIQKDGTLSFQNATVTTIGFTKTPENLIEFANSIVSTNNGLQRPGYNKTTLLLQLDKTLKLPNEGYEMSIDKKGMIIKSVSESGIFYGLQTLIQLVTDQTHPDLINLPFQLCFLDPAKTYIATLYADGKTADYEKNPTSYQVTKGLVTTKTKVSCKLARSGGFAMNIIEATAADKKQVGKWK